MKLYRPEERLPDNNEYVLAYFPDMPWDEDDCVHDQHKWVVTKFLRGLSLEEREKLDKKDPRKHIFCSEDEWSNNEVPYFWDTFGSDSFFGQECEYWCQLPRIEDARTD